MAWAKQLASTGDFEVACARTLFRFSQEHLFLCSFPIQPACQLLSSGASSRNCGLGIVWDHARWYLLISLCPRQPPDLAVLAQHPGQMSFLLLDRWWGPGKKKHCGGNALSESFWSLILKSKEVKRKRYILHIHNEQIMWRSAIVSGKLAQKCAYTNGGKAETGSCTHSSLLGFSDCCWCSLHHLLNRGVAIAAAYSFISWIPPQGGVTAGSTCSFTLPSAGSS